MSNMPNTEAEIASEWEVQREKDRQADFARRRAEPDFIKYGVDECAATGGGHGRYDLQSDGRHYCEYCGAEILPEHVKEWEAMQDDEK